MTGKKSPRLLARSFKRDQRAGVATISVLEEYMPHKKGKKEPGNYQRQEGFPPLRGLDVRTKKPTTSSRR